MGTGVLSTGDKILYTMKDMDMGIPGLAALRNAGLWLVSLSL